MLDLARRKIAELHRKPRSVADEICIDCGSPIGERPSVLVYYGEYGWKRNHLQCHEPQVIVESSDVIEV